MKTLEVKRVIYAKKDTPAEIKEYRMMFCGATTAVGNRQEWKNFAKKHGYNKVKFLENNGTSWEQFIF